LGFSQILCEVRASERPTPFKNKLCNFIYVIQIQYWDRQR